MIERRAFITLLGCSATAWPGAQSGTAAQPVDSLPEDSWARRSAGGIRRRYSEIGWSRAGISIIIASRLGTRLFVMTIILWLAISRPYLKHQAAHRPGPVTVTNRSATAGLGFVQPPAARRNITRFSPTDAPSIGWFSRSKRPPGITSVAAIFNP